MEYIEENNNNNNNHMYNTGKLYSQLITQNHNFKAYR